MMVNRNDLHNLTFDNLTFDLHNLTFDAHNLIFDNLCVLSFIAVINMSVNSSGTNPLPNEIQNT